MDNPEKLATYGTQVEEKQNKNTTQKKRERKTIYDVFKLYITSSKIGSNCQARIFIARNYSETFAFI